MSVDGDTSAVTVDNAAGNPETKSRSVRLMRHKRIEERRQIFVRNARAIIYYMDGEIRSIKMCGKSDNTGSGTLHRRSFGRSGCVKGI